MFVKKLSLCHKLRISNPYIFAAQCTCRPYIFQPMNYVSSNNLSLKNQRFTPIGWKDRLENHSLWNRLNSNLKIFSSTDFADSKFYFFCFLKAVSIYLFIHLFNLLLTELSKLRQSSKDTHQPTKKKCDNATFWNHC